MKKFDYKILNKHPIPQRLRNNIESIFGDSTNPAVLLGAFVGDGDMLGTDLFVNRGEAPTEQFEAKILEYLALIAGKFDSRHEDSIIRRDQLLVEARSYLIVLREFYRFFKEPEKGATPFS